MLCTLPISIIGYALIRTTTSNNVSLTDKDLTDRADDARQVKYGALFLMSAGLYSSVPPVLVWLSNNTAPHYKRATTAAMQLAIAKYVPVPLPAPTDTEPAAPALSRRSSTPRRKDRPTSRVTRSS